MRWKSSRRTAHRADRKSVIDIHECKQVLTLLAGVAGLESTLDRSEGCHSRSTIQYSSSFQGVPLLDGPRYQDDHVLQSTQVLRAVDPPSPNGLDAGRAQRYGVTSHVISFRLQCAGMQYSLATNDSLTDNLAQHRTDAESSRKCFKAICLVS